MAAADRFDIVLRGRGGHAAQPHRTPGVLLAASQLVTQLNTYPAKANSPAEAQVALRAAELAGLKAGVAPRPAFTSEDFARMVRERSGAYLWLGQGGNERPLHHPGYDFNDDALPHSHVAEVLLDADVALELR